MGEAFSCEFESVYILVLRAGELSVIDDIVHTNMKIVYRVTTISNHEIFPLNRIEVMLFKNVSFFLQILVAFALAGIVELKSSSKREKKSVTILGSSGYDFFGVAPIFSTGSWPPTSFGSALWNPTGVPDIPLTQVQAQATHNVALQV
ncbi:hypothetical protein K0M31_008772 [Melipona bicolor]|uniref:Uncharacterized protein n=1 Tax=Melipona bicolor TaxID=60889 RepID=A0AA40FPS9_9HYME|nr:hypothetical protein K0M31_008772 [Melipona bicolor]